MSYKGRFKPKHYKKYKGDPTKVIYRSMWELRFMKYCDKNPSILEWSSEEIIIPYRGLDKILQCALSSCLILFSPF